MAHQNFDDIYCRFKSILGCRTQIELAEALGIRQSSISDAKRRRSIPPDWYLTLYDIAGINPDWLRSGIGPIYLKNNNNKLPTDYNTSNRQLDEETYTSCKILPVFMENKAEDNRSRLLLMREIAIPNFLASDTITIFYHKYSNDFYNAKFAYIGAETKNKNPIHGQKYIMSLNTHFFCLKSLDIEDNRFLLKNHINDNHPMIITSDEFIKSVTGQVVWSIDIY